MTGFGALLWSRPEAEVPREHLKHVVYHVSRVAEFGPTPPDSPSFDFSTA